MLEQVFESPALRQGTLTQPDLRLGFVFVPPFALDSPLRGWHPNIRNAALPQLDRGSDYESERHRFESCTPHQRTRAGPLGVPLFWAKAITRHSHLTLPSGGGILISATRRYLSWIEGLTTNQNVTGSNPVRRTSGRERGPSGPRFLPRRPLAKTAQQPLCRGRKMIVLSPQAVRA